MRLAVIAGDGIGPEVVTEGLKVLREVAPDVEPTHYDLGAMRWQRTDELLPDTVLDELRGHDAILLGAIGDPSVPAGDPRARAAAAAALRARPPRQPPPGAAVRRRHQPAGRPRARRHALRAGRHRGPLRRQRRRPPQGHPAGGRHRGKPQHRLRRRAGGALRLRAGRHAAAQAPDADPQDQRAHPRRRPLVAHGGGGVGRVPRGHRRLPARRRRLDVLHHRPGPLRRHRHRQPLRRHRHRHRGRGHRRHRAGRQRQPGRVGHQPEHVRAGARIGPRHRRAGHRRPTATVLSVGLLLEHLGRTEQARKVNAAVAFDLSTRSPQGPVRTTDVGDRLAALASG